MADDGDNAAETADGDDPPESHTGDGVETIGGRESMRDDERQWKFSLEDIAQREQDDDPDDGGGNVAGTLDREEPLEPGDISLENAAFVLLGVLIVVGLIASIAVSL